MHTTVAMSPFPVRRIQGGVTMGYYPTIQAAFNAAASGDVIQTRAETFIESPVFNLIKDVTLRGGYDSLYLSQTGYSTIAGTATIGASKIIPEYLIMR
jgi:hypothetical protein